MKTSKRFENAVSKLYAAFHEDRLNANICAACAVGNICDNEPLWSDMCGGYGITGELGTLKKYIDEEVLDFIKPFGYSPLELVTIEKVFLNAMGFYTYEEIKDHKSKSLQFKGLCAVVEYLCQLEGISNMMDYTSLFETENDKPKKELIEVFE